MGDSFKPSMGWVRLWRSIRDNDFWQEKPFSSGQAWVDLFLRASWIESSVFYQGHDVALKRGDLAVSIRQLARDWGWSRARAARFVVLLENRAMIRTRNEPQFLVVTICNYELYQSDEEKRATNRTTNLATGLATGLATIKEVEEGKERKKGRPPSPPPGGNAAPPKRTGASCPVCNGILKNSDGIFMVRPMRDEATGMIRIPERACESCNPPAKLAAWKKHQEWLADYSASCKVPEKEGAKTG